MFKSTDFISDSQQDMKRPNSKINEQWEMRTEYDFSDARRNKYAEKYAEDKNIVLIEPDPIEFFPDKGNEKR